MTTNLSSQLASLSDSLKSIDSLIHRLSTLNFQPGSEPLTDENSVRAELAQDIHESLKQLEEDLELLKQEAEDLASSNHGGTPGLRGRRESVNDRDRDRTRLNAQVSRLEEDLRSSRAHFRRAQLNAKKASELAKQKEREAVFASLQNPLQNSSDPEKDRNDLFAGRRSKPQQQKTQEQQEVDASASVTAALRRTHNLLSTELSRSRFAQETFDQSTAALAELGERYTSLDSVLKNSRELLGTLLRSQKSDTWYLETAFYILITTLIWLIFRRILLGPFIRLPLFVLNWGLWLLWKPIYAFLYLTGVITTEEVSSPSAVSRSLTSARTPLIVQPSAAGSGDIPRIDEQMAEKMRQNGGVPVGAGGSHAKQGENSRQNDPSEQGGKEDAVLDGEMSERIGRMAQERKGRDAEEVRRADGTVLRERGEDEPPNPRKKMFDANVEDAKHEQAQHEKDEL